MYKLSKRSMSNLKGVHPDMVAVVERAIQITPIDFGVSEGVRTVERQKQLVAEGKSTTMNSKHIPVYFNGYESAFPALGYYGAAVDLFVLVDGKVTWEHKHFRKLIQSVFTAAIELGVQLEAGALWRDFLDSPHIQLNMKYYE
jgi:peptidoglycan L-alanyl-D-glutamate endopeptidase CwlK